MSERATGDDNGEAVSGRLEHLVESNQRCTGTAEEPLYTCSVV